MEGYGAGYGAGGRVDGGAMSCADDEATGCVVEDFRAFATAFFFAAFFPVDPDGLEAATAAELKMSSAPTDVSCVCSELGGGSAMVPCGPDMMKDIRVLACDAG